MKLMSVLRIFGASVCLGFQAISSFAAVTDVQSFLIAKGQEFEQTSTNPPSLSSSNSSFSFFSSVDLSHSGTVSAASLRSPDGKTNQLIDLGETFEFQQTFSNKTLLDRMFGRGKYTFSINTLSEGTKTPVLNLTPDAYPPTPQVENWTDLQEVDSGLPFAVNWNRFVTGSSNDFILFEISDAGTPVFSTPGMLDGGALNGTNRFVTVPENTLAPDKTYEGRILFVKQTGKNDTNYPGARGNFRLF